MEEGCGDNSFSYSQKVCEILHLKYRGALVKQRGIEKEVEIVG